MAQGWMLFVAALGLMATLVSGDISTMESWATVFQPAFIGSVLAHFGVVVAAFLGGKLLPQAGTGTK